MFQKPLPSKTSLQIMYLVLPLIIIAFSDKYFDIIITQTSSIASGCGLPPAITIRNLKQWTCISCVSVVCSKSWDFWTCEFNKKTIYEVGLMAYPVSHEEMIIFVCLLYFCVHARMMLVLVCGYFGILYRCSCALR